MDGVGFQQWHALGGPLQTFQHTSLPGLGQLLIDAPEHDRLDNRDDVQGLLKIFEAAFWPLAADGNQEFVQAERRRVRTRVIMPGACVWGAGRAPRGP